MNADLRALIDDAVTSLGPASDAADLTLLAHRVDTWLTRARAALDSPAPVVGDAEIEANFRAWWKERHGEPYFGAVPLVSVIEWTQHLLGRFGGATPAPAPVPVSERLPGAEDCDAWYEFSVFNEDDEEHAGGSGSDLEALRREAAHYHAVYSQDGPHTIQLRRVEVLSALPLPEEAP